MLDIQIRILKSNELILFNSEKKSDRRPTENVYICDRSMARCKRPQFFLTRFNIIFPFKNHQKMIY